MYHGIPDRFLCKKMSSLEEIQDCSFQYFGGVREIRTLAGLATSNDLANRPLQPLEYHSTSSAD